MKRTELRRTAPLRRVSPGRARQNHAYSVLRAEFLEAHPACEACGQRSEEVHHKAGRAGWRLLDETNWCALCSGCHAHLTAHPREAYESGLSVRRHGGAA